MEDFDPEEELPIQPRRQAVQVQEEESLEQIDTSSNPFKKLVTFGGGQHLML